MVSNQWHTYEAEFKSLMTLKIDDLEVIFFDLCAGGGTVKKTGHGDEVN